MNLDAFTAGVTPDGLKNKDEIRILLCYLLKSAQSPIARESLVNLCFEHGFSNYFETTEALSDLIECGNIKKDDKDMLSLSEGGCIIADTFYPKLPITIRERAINAALKLLARSRSEKENQVKIFETSFGCYVECKIMDGNTTLMNVGLSTADKEQANIIKEYFLDNPSALYHSLINLLTNDDTV